MNLNIKNIFQLALTSHQEGKLDEAIIHYKKALEIKPDLSAAHNNLGVIFQSMNKLNEAENSFKKALEINPNQVDAHNNLGSILYKLNKLEDAEKSYKKAIDLKSDNYVSYNNLGTVLFKLNKLEDAEKSYKKAIELKPDYNASTYDNLGKIYEIVGKLDEAYSNYDKASYIESDNPIYYARRGFSKLFYVREPLSTNKNFIESINLGDWENSKIQLEKICNKNLNFLKSYNDEFIELWCDKCKYLLSKGDLNRFIKIFIKLIIIGERNLNFEKLIKFFFDTFDLKKIIEIVDKNDKILINLSYCHYKFLLKEFSSLEILATSNIKETVNLIQNNKTEDLGWLVVRRSLKFYQNKDLSRKTLNNLISSL